MTNAAATPASVRNAATGAPNLTRPGDALAAPDANTAGTYEVSTASWGDAPTYGFARPADLLSVAASSRREPVTFESEGVALAGHLYLPPAETNTAGRPAPAVALLGPMTFVKEQAPAEYARRLASAGFVALTFDPRGRGASGEGGGVVRDQEDPLAKAIDMRHAVTFLANHPAVDPARIAAVAVCQGSSAMLRAAADDPRIRAVATLAGHYRDHAGDVAWLGGEDALATRRARGEAARAHFAASGEVLTVPAVDPERTDVGMPGEFVWRWYQPWADAGVWPNRYAVMSDAALLAYESRSAAERLTTPYLMIHSDQSFLPAAARRHFDAVPGPTKRLLWAGETLHFQFYDDPVVLDEATAHIVAWFRTHLG